MQRFSFLILVPLVIVRYGCSLLNVDPPDDWDAGQMDSGVHDGGPIHDAGPIDICGDGRCSPSETCSSCPADCGPCGGCGDGTCSTNENCESCPADCGVCDTCPNG